MAKQTRRMISLLLAVCMVLSFGLAGIPAAAEEAALSQTRDFDEAFDRMLDAVVGSTEAELAYRASAWEAGQCDDIEDPIYKIAGPKISAGFDQLILEVRSPDESVKLSDLILGIRISDAVPVQSYALNHDDITGGITLSEGEDIGADWTTISVDFAQTEVGIETSNPDAMVGFHLYSAGGAGKLDIRMVAVSKGGNETVVKQFDGADYGIWWDGGEAGTFSIVPPCYAIADSMQIASEVATSNNTDGKYSAVVLGIFGSGDVTLAPVLADGTVGAAKAWSELKDLEGNPVSAVDGTDRNLVIALDSLGAKEIRGVVVAVSGGSVNVSRVFFTNLEEVVPAVNFPVLDMNTVDYMTQFDYEYLTAGPDYDKAVTDCAGFGMNYILSYSGKNNVITNGHLVMDAKGEAYTNLKIRSNVPSAGRQYLVIKYMLNGRNDLTDFRFDVLSTATDMGVAIKYPHEWVADTALPSISGLNPYAGEQYSYLVIDIAKTWGINDISGVDMYISGEGQILIDEIFYADAVGASLQYTEEVLAADFPGKEITAGGPGYSYVGWVNGSVGKGHRYMELTVEGDISLLRIEMAGGVYWAKENAQGTLKDANGNNLSQLTGAQTVLIDLVASGVNIGALADMHIHNEFAAAGDVLKVTSLRFAKELPPELPWGEEALAADFPGKEVTAGGSGYSYIGWIDGSVGKGNRYMQLEVEGDFSLLRIEMAGGVYWAKENAQGTLKDYSGQNLAVHSGKQILVLDLIASGVDINKLGDMHIHNEFAAAGDVLKVTSVKFANEVVNEITWGEEVLADDFPGKELTAGGEGYAYVGWINGAAGAGNRYMMMEVEGDLSQLRVEMEGLGVFWVSENPQGTLKNVYGRVFASTTGAQTLVIDLEASGADFAALGNIHIHNTFAAAGDVLKITSVKFGNVKIDLTENDDAKPVIQWTVPSGVKEGDEVSLSASASDNYSAAEAIAITFEVTLDGKAVEVKDGKFVAAAGTYTIKVIAADEAGNEAVDTQTLTVEAKKPAEPDPQPTEPQPTQPQPTQPQPTQPQPTESQPAGTEPGGAADKGGMSPAVIVIIVVVLLGAAAAVVLVLNKKK